MKIPNGTPQTLKDLKAKIEVKVKSIENSSTKLVIIFNNDFIYKIFSCKEKEIFVVTIDEHNYIFDFEQEDLGIEAFTCVLNIPITSSPLKEGALTVPCNVDPDEFIWFDIFKLNDNNKK